jgi:hypothetical protein
MEAVDERSMQEAAKVGFVTRNSVAQQMRNADVALETIRRGVGSYPLNRAVVLAEFALGNWLPFIGTGEMTPKDTLDAAAKEYIAEATKQGYLK